MVKITSFLKVLTIGCAVILVLIWNADVSSTRRLQSILDDDHVDLERP